MLRNKLSDRKNMYQLYLQKERNKPQRFNLNTIAYDSDLQLLEYFQRDHDFTLADEIKGSELRFLFHWAVQTEKGTLKEKLDFLHSLIGLLKVENYWKQPKVNMSALLAEVYQRVTILQDNILHLIISNDTLSDSETVQFIKKLFEYMPLESEQIKLIQDRNDLGYSAFDFASMLGKTETSAYLQHVIPQNAAGVCAGPIPVNQLRNF